MTAQQRGSGSNRSVTRAFVISILCIATIGGQGQADVPDLTAAIVVAISMGYLIVTAARVAPNTVGAYTGLMMLLVFWLKWLFHSEPLTHIYWLPYDNNRAIEATAAFCVPLAIGWRFGLHPSRAKIANPVPVQMQQQPLRLGPLVTIGVASVVLRYLSAQTLHIGVPGREPVSLGVPLLAGLIFYVGTYAPLLLGVAALFANRQPFERLGAALAILIPYAIVGILLGARGMVASSALALAYALLGTRDSMTGSPRRPGVPGRRALAGVAVGLTTLFLLSKALERRGSISGTSPLLGAFQFITDRLGGLSYLSVAIVGVDAHGASLAFINPAAWDQFLLVDVYRYPVGAINGVSGTLIGLAYGIGSFYAVFLAGLLFGFAIGLIDGRLRIGSTLVTPVRHFGLLLAWSNLLLEGTAKVAGLVAIFTIALSSAHFFRERTHQAQRRASATSECTTLDRRPGRPRRPG